jgi:hypothetical protein
MNDEIIVEEESSALAPRRTLLLKAYTHFELM